MSPDDPALIEAQAHRELWAGDPASALPLVVRVREMRPQDPKLRELEAHVAEWAGKPALALDDWLWLLSHGITPKP
jgi:Flp pilus assembly protein TadD